MDVPKEIDIRVTKNIMANVRPPLLKQTKSSCSIAPRTKKLFEIKFN